MTMPTHAPAHAPGSRRSSHPNAALALPAPPSPNKPSPPPSPTSGSPTSHTPAITAAPHPHPPTGRRNSLVVHTTSPTSTDLAAPGPDSGSTSTAALALASGSLPDAPQSHPDAHEAFVTEHVAGQLDLAEAWDDLGANAGVVMGRGYSGNAKRRPATRGAEGAGAGVGGSEDDHAGVDDEAPLMVLLRPATYRIGPQTKPGFVLGAEMVVDEAEGRTAGKFGGEAARKAAEQEQGKGKGLLLPILDLRDFTPTPAHLPLSVWMFTSAVASLYATRVDRLVLYQCPWMPRMLWNTFSPLVPSHLRRLVTFVDTPEDLVKHVGPASQISTELGGTRPKDMCPTVQDLIVKRVERLEKAGGQGMQQTLAQAQALA